MKKGIIEVTQLKLKFAGLLIRLVVAFLLFQKTAHSASLLAESLLKR